MSIISKIKDLINPQELSYGEQQEKEIRELHKKNQKKDRKIEDRQRRIADCSAILHECMDVFEKSIMVENARAAQLRTKGYPSPNHRSRVREAAIGMLVADQALIELDCMQTEHELNQAMNRMGTVLRQIRRLDNGTDALSFSTKKLIAKWYPYPLDENEGDKNYHAEFEIPQEITDRVNDEFIQELMDGTGFRMAIALSGEPSEPYAPEKTRYEDAFNAIKNDLPSANDEEMRQAMKDKYSNPF